MTVLDVLRPTGRPSGSRAPVAGSSPLLSTRPGVPLVVARLCCTVVLIRLMYVWQPLRSDEGGYLYAARHWKTGGAFLYGDFHVDRPPLLMLVYRIAAFSDWDGLIRVLTLPFAVLVVVATARSGFLLAGCRGACWSAMVVAAWATSPVLAADQADGEIFAIPLVAASVACTLDGWRSCGARQRLALALAAGVLGASAALMKQNFLEGLIFGGALLVADAVSRRRVTPRVRQMAAAGALGALAPIVAILGWTLATDHQLQALWAELVSFRGEALGVIADGSLQAPVRRAAVLIVLACVSALLPIAWAWFTAVRRETSLREPEHTALTVGLLVGIAALVAGGSYWPHYLLQLVPLLALAAGVLAARSTELGAQLRKRCRLAAVSSVAAAVVGVAVYASVPAVWFQQRTGQWLAHSQNPEDTALIAYGNASILETADMSTPYPYLWSLQMRTLDADQQHLRAVLASNDAPIWLVEPTDWNSWHIDDSGRLRALVQRKYDVVAEICGHPVWLRSDQKRALAPTPSCAFDRLRSGVARR